MQKFPKNCGILPAADPTFDSLCPSRLYVSEDYACAWKRPDFHWSYRERAHISILAAAICRAGGVALEEYGTKKERDKTDYPGRGDLCFKLTTSSKDTGYIAEAKHRHVNCGNSCVHGPPICG